MRYPMLLGIAMPVALIAASAISSNQAAQTSSNVQSEKIKALMTERSDVLAKRVAAFETMYTHGDCNFATLVNARDDSFVAKLDLVETRGERIELLESRLESLKNGEQQMRVLLEQVYGATPAEVLFVTSQRLLAEIELERARIN